MDDRDGVSIRLSGIAEIYEAYVAGKPKFKKGEKNTRGKERPIQYCWLRRAEQVSDYISARAMLSSLTNVKWLLGHRGHDAAWFRDALQDKGIHACIPGRRQRKPPVKYDKRRNRPSRDIAAQCTAGQ